MKLGTQLPSYSQLTVATSFRGPTLLRIPTGTTNTGAERELSKMPQTNRQEKLLRHLLGTRIKHKTDSHKGKIFWHWNYPKDHLLPTWTSWLLSALIHWLFYPNSSVTHPQKPYPTTSSSKSTRCWCEACSSEQHYCYSFDLSCVSSKAHQTDTPTWSFFQELLTGSTKATTCTQ